eukprot:COSAG06_NODE_34657_length_471_cov_1.010753_2_plen_20_part_01
MLRLATKYVVDNLRSQKVAL